ncbi:MAG TPA: hypothetical protein PLU11_11770 [Chitinophagaceae bacterium]|nr:hypothetical protein [Chitinophagaceae bacterium]HPH31740.1 hypothetical protein [Chitinophagaceae bacterium]HPN59849.1 hypothetical protein [Chitinophagaceae bacterium]
MKKYALLAVVFLYTFLLSAQSYVTIHEDCDYRGKSYTLEAGTYRLYQMRIGNDKLSSFQVPSGFRITIYENDDFNSRSKTFTESVSCLDSAWDNNASAIVVENTNIQQTNPNEYVVIYSDCYSRGFSRSLRPGVYKGTDLGELKNNISSFAIFGNLRMRIYTGSDDASGYFVTLENSETCLSRNYNDRISSLVVEYKPYTTPGTGNNSNNGSYAEFYTDCNYKGNKLSLLPGRYTGEELGLFRKTIGSMQIPAGISVKVYEGDNLMGASETYSSGFDCISYSWRNRISSLVVEEKGGWSGNGNPMVNELTLYTDAGYKGQSVTLLPGTYKTMAAANGFPEKALSSIQIPPGYRVVLYDQPNLRGKSMTLTASRSSFAMSSWNDRAASIAVYRN